MIAPRLLETLDARTRWRPALGASLLARADAAKRARRGWPRAQEELPPDPFTEPATRDVGREGRFGVDPYPWGSLSRTTRGTVVDDNDAPPTMRPPAPEQTTLPPASPQGARPPSTDPEGAPPPSVEAKAPDGERHPRTGTASAPTTETGATDLPLREADRPEQADAHGTRLRATAAGSTATEPFWAGLAQGSEPVPLTGMQIRPATTQSTEPRGRTRTRAAVDPLEPAIAPDLRVSPAAPSPPPTPLKDQPPGPKDAASAATRMPDTSPLSRGDRSAVPMTAQSDAVTADHRPAVPSPATQPQRRTPERHLVEAVARELRIDAARERERRGEWP